MHGVHNYKRKGFSISHSTDVKQIGLLGIPEECKLLISLKWHLELINRTHRKTTSTFIQFPLLVAL